MEKDQQTRRLFDISPIPKERQVINLNELRFSSDQIVIGTRFTGISNEDMLNILIDKLTEWTCIGDPGEKKSKKDLEDFRERIAKIRQNRYLIQNLCLGGPRPAGVLKDFAQKHKFFGSLKDYELVILPRDLNQLPISNSRRIFLPTQINFLSFMTEVGMYSTGRERIGKLGTKSTITLSKVSHRDTPSRFTNYDLTIRTRPILNVEEQRSIDALHEESASFHKEAQRYELRRQVRAGLPGLGRRR